MKQKLRQSSPVKLPHDGPLNCYYYDNKRKKNDGCIPRRNSAEAVSDDDDDRDEFQNNDKNTIIQHCLNLLDLVNDAARDSTLTHDTSNSKQAIKSSNDDDDEHSKLLTSSSASQNTGSNREKIVIMIRELAQAATVQDQCAQLQKFRRKGVSPSPDDNNSNMTMKKSCIDEDMNGTSDNFYDEDLAWYRILLEWSLGYQTPYHLMRAVQAVLESSVSSLPQHQRDMVLRQVMESILVVSNSSESNNHAEAAEGNWKNPVQSLTRLLQWGWSSNNNHHDNCTKKDKTGGRTSSSTGDESGKHEGMLSVSSPPTLATSSELSVWMITRCWEFCRQKARDLLTKLTANSATNRGEAMPLTFGNNNERSSSALVEESDADVVEEAVLVVNLIKLLLEIVSADRATLMQSTTSITIDTGTDRSQRENEDHDRRMPSIIPPFSVTTLLLDFVWCLLQCPKVESASLPTIGVVLGSLVVLSRPLPFDNSVCNYSETIGVAATILEWRHRAKRELTSSVRTCITWNGLLAAADVATKNSRSSASAMLHGFVEDLTEASGHADVGVRVAALQAWRTLIGKSMAFVEYTHGHDKARSKEEEDGIAIVKNIAQKALDVIWASWDSSVKPVGNAVTRLFAVTVKLLQILAMSMSELVQQVLVQPPSRRSRYRGLETLLPQVGATRLLENPVLLDELMLGISDQHGHHTRIIADLWTQTLQGYLKELMHEAGVVFSTKKKQSQAKSTRDIGAEILPSILNTWSDKWIPSLAKALLDPIDSRRTKVSNFCFSRIPKMMSAAAKPYVSYCMGRLLTRLTRTYVDTSTGNVETAAYCDCQIWAVCETVRESYSQGLLGQVSVHGLTLDDIMSQTITMDLLETSLLHFSAQIRLAAFRVILPVVQVYHGERQDAMLEEVKLWRRAFLFSAKSSDQKYTKSLLGTLLAFLDRLSQYSVTVTENNPDILLEFTTNYLVNDLFVVKLAYPGSVVDKEMFGLSVMEAILGLVCREGKLEFSVIQSSRSDAVMERSRSNAEELVFARIRESLVTLRVFEALVMLLHSRWESVQSLSYRTLLNIFSMSRYYNIRSMPPFAPTKEISHFERNATELAFSPKQRESDTGARILSAVALSVPTEKMLVEFVARTVALLDTRLESMKDQLQRFVKNEPDGPSNLVTAHGIIQTLRLVCHHHQFQCIKTDETPALKQLWISLVKSCTQALQLSLAVVADIYESLDGMDGELQMDIQNVNPGAIGANGIFSSIERLTLEERRRRNISQQIVVGSWLVTKEACAALSTVIGHLSSAIDPKVVDRVGAVLISALVCLKHTGAAYAAHKALQDTATLWQDLATGWGERLFDEIVSSEKVRDSTLRRSTGYGLGFLAVMRAEVYSRPSSQPHAVSLLERIIHATLPSKAKMDEFGTAFADTKNHGKSMFSFIGSSKGLKSELNYANHSTRTRVHALNVLRFIILDAPLSKVVFPALGDALVASIIGYTDSDWSVRNSSTMVFSAILLRAVDADKNAAGKVTNNEKRSAVTISELFQSYPALADFFQALLKTATENSILLATSPVLPILLLFCRIQPVRFSGYEAASEVAPILPLLILYLSNRQVAIRRAAAQAVANCVVENKAFLDETAMGIAHAFRESDWNKLHGNLLAARAVLHASPIASPELQRHAFSFVETTKQNVVPPLCAAVSLEVLALLCSSADDQEKLRNVYDKLIFQQQPISAGASQLSVTYASVSSKLVLMELCTSAESRPTALSFMTLLIESDCLDVRQTSTKVFKKKLHDKLAELQMRQEIALEGKSRIVASLTAVVQQALTKELQRDGGATARSHPPTLRRLSRCLIECASLQKTIDPGKSNYFSSLGHRLIDKDGATKLKLPEFIQCATQLTGNGVELLSLSEAGVQNEAYRLCDARLPWRLRFSAVCSMSKAGGPCDQSLPWLLSCLQDEDPDIRESACRALKQDSIASPEFTIQATLALASASSILSCVEHQISSLTDAAVALQKSVTLVGEESETCVIFEEEEPNSFGERLLLIQQLVRAATKIATHNLDASKTSQLVLNTTQVLKVLLPILEKIDSNSGSCDLCRRPEIFVDLYGMLLLSWVVLKDSSDSGSRHGRAELGVLASRLATSSTVPELCYLALSISELPSCDQNAVERICFLLN